jgi:hypothetical protein
MKYRMCGDTVELLRYIVTYEDKVKDWNKEEKKIIEKTVKYTEYCISDQHRDEFIESLKEKPYTVETIDQNGNEWMDGMTFMDPSKVEIAIQLGEDKYKQYIYDTNENLQFSKYLTDLDYRLLLLEWGIKS